MKKIRIIVCLLLLALLLTTPAITAAWLTDSGMNADINATAHIHKSYFESGDGSAEDPFEIARPVQLYYLAWLQELGYFNIPAGSGNTVPAVYFYLSQDLDMTGFVLPPIGTQKYEFIGNFDGKGHTVSNLTVTTNDISTTNKLTDSPESDKLTGVDIVGFFGVIGSLDLSEHTVHACVSNGTVSTSTPNYTYDTSVNEVKNFMLNNVTVVTVEAKTLIGIAAGYVNGTVQNVAVAGSGMTVKKGTTPLNTTSFTSNLSDFALMGFCTAAFKDALTAHVVTTALPAAQKSQYNASESGNAWGGSIDMVGLVYRMLAAFKEEQRTIPTSGQYLTSQTIRVDEFTGKDVSSNERYSTTNPHNSNTTTSQVRYFYTEDAGSYYVQQATANPPHMYASGPSNGTTNTVTKIVTKAVFDADGKPTGYLTTDAFYLHNGSNYLSMNAGHTAVANATTQGNAMRWSMTDDGYLFVQTNDGQYFLNATTSLSVGETGSTKWTLRNDGCLTYSYNNTTYCLWLNGTTWTVSPATQVSPTLQILAGYVITDGQGHYLHVTGTGTTSFDNVSTAEEASLWSFSTAASLSGYISTDYDGQPVYLRRNNSNALRLTTDTNNRTNWSNSGGVLNNNSYCIAYDNGWKLIQMSSLTYTISDGNGNYLNAKNDGTLTNGTDPASATKWTFSNFSGSGTISTTVNSQTRYLRVERTGNSSNYTYNLKLDASSQNWTNTNNSFRNDEFNDRYLSRNDTGWRVSRNVMTLTFNSKAGTPVQVNQAPTALTKDGTTQARVVIKTTEQVPTGPISYIPITVDGTLAQFQNYSKGNYQYFKTAEANTGYIVGGYYCSDGSRYGDVRASGYAISNISESYSGGKITKIYTIDGNVKNTSHETLIYDSTKLDTVTRYRDYMKFSPSLETLKTMLASGGDNVYGIHFMNSAISMDHLIVASKVTINGDVYTNYQLPENSIDFNLKEKGYINFFGGTYYGGSDEGFFSLHQIIRNPATNTDIGFNDYYEPNEIIEIKQISKVFAYTGDDPQAVYIYEYTDGTNVTFSPDKNGNVYTSEAALKSAGYAEVFDMEWIGNRKPYMSGSEIPQNRIYYFEIPANEGEYALGSVDGANGAYLMYLDISAAAQTVDRVEVLEQFKVKEASVSFPKGAKFVASGTDLPTTVASGTDFFAADNATFAVASSANSSADASYTFTRSGNTITPNPTTGLSVSYIGPGITVPTGIPSTSAVTPVTPESIVRTVWRVTDNDINQTSKKGTRLVTTVVQEGSTWNVTVQCWLLGSDPENSSTYGVPTTTDPIGTLTYTCPANTPIKQSYIYVPGADDAPGTWSVFLGSRTNDISNISMSAASNYSIKLNTSETIATLIAASDEVEATSTLIPGLTLGTETNAFHYAVPLSNSTYADVTSVFALPVLNNGADMMPTTPVSSSTETVAVAITSAAYSTVTVTATGSIAASIMNDLPTRGSITIGSYTSNTSSSAQ